MTDIGHIEALYRYPIKSMAGEQLESASLGWNGIEGDRRLALRRTGVQNGFPWLTATRFPQLILFKPFRREGTQGELPTHVRTPEGIEIEVFDEELAADVERRYRSPVEMIYLRHGIFDDAAISVITTDTVEEIARLAGNGSDVRRFRPNIVVRLHNPGGFQEDTWLGGILSFGDPGGPRVSVTMRDTRCSMVNLDIDSADANPNVLKSIVNRNDNKAGVYGTIISTGTLAVGQSIHFLPPSR